MIVGGAGAWQIDKTGSRERLGIDCVINGRAESRILDVFRMAGEGEDLPPVVNAPEPAVENLITPRKRSTYGIVEMNRGCGRQCAFCSPTLETRISVPLPDELKAVCANTSNGARIIFPVSEDVFIYGASAPFYVPNSAGRRRWPAGGRPRADHGAVRPAPDAGWSASGRRPPRSAPDGR